MKISNEKIWGMKFFGEKMRGMKKSGFLEKIFREGIRNKKCPPPNMIDHVTCIPFIKPLEFSARAINISKQEIYRILWIIA